MSNKIKRTNILKNELIDTLKKGGGGGGVI